MAKCSKCGMHIPDDAEICPYCHEKTTNSLVGTVLVVAFFGFILFLFIRDIWPLLLFIALLLVSFVGVLMFREKIRQLPLKHNLAVMLGLAGLLFLGWKLTEYKMHDIAYSPSRYVGTWDGYNSNNEEVYLFKIHDDLTNDHEWVGADGNIYSAHYQRIFIKDTICYFTNSPINNPEEADIWLSISCAKSKMEGMGCVFDKRGAW